MQKKEKYTLWTNPMNNWNRAFDNVTITPAVEKAVEKQLQKVDSKKIAERAKAFTTPVTSETLSKTVG
jgi:hypothetical protein